MGTIEWGHDIADVYDSTYAALEDPSIVDPMVDVLVEYAGGANALEFAVGTGRIALPLSARGISVSGIELSSAMAEHMRRKPGADAVPVEIGDMATVRLGEAFQLVYVVANALMNLTTQEEQLATFANAARHLVPGGHFIVELMVPQLRRVPLSESARVFTLDPDHVGIETFDDTVGQVAWSHHWMVIDGALTRHSAPYRYIWPSELVLMANLAGLALENRWGYWNRTPFTSESALQVAVFVKR